MQESNRRVKIAWGGDREQTVPGTWRVERDIGGLSVELTRVDCEHLEQVGVPRAWLYDEPVEIEPGHVWWKAKGFPSEMLPGLLTRGGEIVDRNGLRTEADRCEILPAHTTPPENENELTEGFDDPTAGQASRTISKDELFRRMDEHDRPSYARRWWDLSAGEQNFVMGLVGADTHVTARVYRHIRELISFLTLRSAEEFEKEDLDEIQKVISNHRNDPYQKRTRAIAAKALEIAQRSTP